MVEQQRVALGILSEYTSCDEQRFCSPLFKQKMEQMVCRDLRMGETVRMHHVQWVPRNDKVAKQFRTVGLALFECKVDL